ncbi:trypsin-like serine protease [Mycolicibacterium sp. 018/SC-01/001]|uniref:trypsin-like peptidase domain-containing protein n=1 Tax=Mycolicibacterium sp. 018/SC-01/001 TaxID=2592069 RepID=UPI00118129F6|nr:trypsin-like peptidase domain-containing protein [Mycolicibacterium sp. 018/SC-01/001]TRW84865.1 trypsin-like serine protease [Mycolicibacterium sp. 018/SC-01/001]
MRPIVPVRHLLAVLGTVVLSACGTAYPAPPPAGQPEPTAAEEESLAAAHPVPPDPRIGALFYGTDNLHFCTASVISSAVADLILTAAHCVTDGTDTTFVPQFSDAMAPGTEWHLDAIYLDPRWMANQDPSADIAVARVSRDDGDSLRALAGGGFTVGVTPVPGTPVTVVGYGYGTGGGPTACSAPTAAPRDGFPVVRCGGIVAGFSGAPWVAGSTVVGVIGGLDGGGCRDEVSYTPAFGAAVHTLVARAEAGGPADDPPTDFDDGCG